MLVKHFFKLICGGVGMRFSGEKEVMSPPEFMQKYINTPLWTARIDMIRAGIVDGAFCFTISVLEEEAA